MDPGGPVSRAPRTVLALLALLAGSLLLAAPVRKPPAVPARAGILNVQALAPFLEALRRLERPEPEGRVRILQFGDSHTAADFWSGRIRQRLQARFGDGGPGFLAPGKPWRGYPHDGARFLAGQGWPAQSLRSGDCDGLVGLAGASVSPRPGELFKVKASFGPFRVFLLGPEPAMVNAWLAPADGEAAALAAAEPAALAPVAFDPIQPGAVLATYGLPGLPGLPGQPGLPEPGAAGPRILSLALPDGVRLLGVDLLSGRPGVVYDELGLNGGQLLDLERWNPGLRAALLQKVQPDLLVLAYGTNDMELDAQARAEFPARARQLLGTLRGAEATPILVVGPLDRLGRKARQRAGLKAGAACVTQALKEACAASGCAFWDARQAMGGYGSILKWRRAGLAQKDLVHLTGPGYQRLGDQLADALLNACDQKPPAAGQGVPLATAAPHPGKAPVRRRPKPRRVP